MINFNVNYDGVKKKLLIFIGESELEEKITKVTSFYVTPDDARLLIDKILSAIPKGK